MISIIRLIYSHPLNRERRCHAVSRFILWQVISRIYKYPILLPFTNKCNYLCWNGLTGLTGNWYYGLMEMEEMSFLLHFIRDEDCFYDIGANVGAFSILASQHSKAEIHSFEPHPITFSYLARNISIQEMKDSVTLHNIAIGDCKGSINFTSDYDTVNHVAIDEKENVVNVEVESLNSLRLTQPSILKIDVEGYEWNVLKGATEIFENRKLQVVIVELNGSGIKYGIKDDDIDLVLKKYGFQPCTYNPFIREIVELEKYTTHNTIYLRDLEFCINRVKSGEKFKLSNGKIL